MEIPDRSNLSAARRYATLVYLCVVLILGYLVCTRGLSQYYASTASEEEPASVDRASSAVNISPKNPYAHEALGTSFLNVRNFEMAAASFRRATEIRKNDYHLWLQLGNALAELGQFDAARSAYERSLDLAPTYSEPNYRMGRLILRAGHHDDAFRFLVKAAKYERKLYHELLETAGAAFPGDPIAMENAVDPQTDAERVLFARHLIENGLMTEKIRSFLAGDVLGPSAKIDFVKYLIYKRDFETARYIWLSEMSRSGRDFDQLMYDSGFETMTAGEGSAFGWEIGPDVSSVAIARARDENRSGSYALQIRFAGAVELNTRIVSQLVFLKRHSRYRLTYSYSSPEMTSAGLPAISINEASSDKLLARSANLKSTGGKWVEEFIDFETADVPAAVISLRRPGCSVSPCPIFGELSLDDFALTLR